MASPADSMPREDQVRAEQIARLVQQLPLNFAANPMAVGAYLVVYWSLFPATTLIAWAVYSQIANLSGVMLAVLHRRAPGRFTDRQWARLFTAFAFFDGLTWGVASWLFLIPESPLHTLFLGGTMLGIAAGAQVAYFSLLPAAAALTGVTMLSLCVRLLFLGGFIYYVLAGLMLVYLGLVLEIARRSNRMLLDAWRLRYQLEGSENRLRENHAQLHDLYENAPTAYASLDPSDGAILRHNAALRRLLGYDSGVLDRMRAADMAADASEIDAVIETARRGAVVDGAEIRLRRRDGHIRCVSLSVAPRLDESGTQVELRAVLVDVTERLEAEAALRRAKDEADAASRAKSDFLSSMSHELRTPMNAVLGFAQILEIDTEPPLSEKQRENVGEILRGGRHLLALINQVLDLEGVESGQVPFDLGDVPAAPLVAECLATARSLGADRGIEIVDRTRDLADTMLRADRTRLMQVLLNLLSNAVKYNRDGGTVTVTGEIADATARVTVADTGLGIPAEKHGEVFQPFSRLGIEKTGIEGAGIGLTIAKKLMAGMDGRIGFDSAPGQGSRFWIEIPLSAAIA